MCLCVCASALWIHLANTLHSIGLMTNHNTSKWLLIVREYNAHLSTSHCLFYWSHISWKLFGLCYTRTHCVRSVFVYCESCRQLWLSRRKSANSTNPLMRVFLGNAVFSINLHIQLLSEFEKVMMNKSASLHTHTRRRRRWSTCNQQPAAS